MRDVVDLAGVGVTGFGNDVADRGAFLSPNPMEPTTLVWNHADGLLEIWT